MVVPVAQTNLCAWWGDARVALENSLQYGAHVDAKSNVVILDALVKRGGWYDVLMIEVLRNIIARYLAQIFEDFLAFENFSHREWGKPVEIDDTLAVFWSTEISLWPFLDVSIQTYGCDVSAWYEEHLVAIGYQIGEWQIAGVGMVHQFAETY